jgi:hypothetical protein
MPSNPIAWPTLPFAFDATPLDPTIAGIGSPSLIVPLPSNGSYATSRDHSGVQLESSARHVSLGGPPASPVRVAF